MPMTLEVSSELEELATQGPAVHQTPSPLEKLKVF